MSCRVDYYYYYAAAAAAAACMYCLLFDIQQHRRAVAVRCFIIVPSSLDKTRGWDLRANIEHYT